MPSISPPDEDTTLDLTNPPFPLTAIDRQILATPDSEYHRTTWSELRRSIAQNSLEDLKRLPSDLRKYLVWSHDIKQRYGGIVPYVIQERLRWTPQATPAAPPLTFAHHSDTPLEDERDYAVLVNDWPYGFEDGIRHLVVWSKTPIATDPERGDITADSRRAIEEFVERLFVRDLGGGAEARDKVLWFKNWVSLQSVRGVDHVHVLVKDVPHELIEKWTQRKDLQ